MSVSTSVSINGSRTDLVFGARYRVRYGRDDRMLVDAKLVERARNGDLVFDEIETLADAKRVRVRPSTIDAIFGSGVEAPIYPAMADPNEVLGPNGTTAFERGEPPNRLPRGICPSCDQVVALRKGGLVREHRRAGAPDGPVCDGSGLPAIEPANSTPNGVRRVRDGDGWKVVPDTHNHIWKCSTCKRRTRAAFCENGHPRVAAPAGARAEDRR